MLASLKATLKKIFTKTFIFQNDCAIIFITMKTKHYTALFAFVATFALSAIIASFFTVEAAYSKTETAQKITALLEQDVSNGTQRNDFAYLEEYALEVTDYVAQMDAIDDSNLPADFQNAWRDHKEAWHNHSVFLNEERYEMSKRDLRYIFQQHSDEIARTWYKTLRIAKQHGAAIPPNAY